MLPQPGLPQRGKQPLPAYSLKGALRPNPSGVRRFNHSVVLPFNLSGVLPFSPNAVPPLNHSGVLRPSPNAVLPLNPSVALSRADRRADQAVVGDQGEAAVEIREIGNEPVACPTPILFYS